MRRKRTLDEHRASIIGVANAIAVDLVESGQSTFILEKSREGWNDRKIAQYLHQHGFHHLDIDMLRRSVCAALRELMNEDERSGITARSRSEQSSANITDFNESMTRRERGEHAKSAVEARGEVPWSDEEKAELLQCIDDVRFQYGEGEGRGRGNGQPDPGMIALYLNRKFHQSEYRRGIMVRDEQTVTIMKYKLTTKLRVKKVASKVKVDGQSLSPLEARVLTMLGQGEYRYLEGQFAGSPMTGDIAEAVGKTYPGIRAIMTKLRRLGLVDQDFYPSPSAQSDG